MEYKRILTIQDISCVGQCSMTVALPVLSACGHETCILPTALLSTHTGGFGKPHVVYFDEALEGMWRHWQENEIAFDAILVGYLGSTGAIRMTEEIIDHLRAYDGVVIVDPVFGDHGKLYSGFDGAYVQAMKGLCQKADIIIPNITEAAMLCGLHYQDQLTEGSTQKLLTELNHPCVILTGTGYEPGTTGATLREGERQILYTHPKVGKNCHGTGDLFAACFTGALMQGKSREKAVQIAADFVCSAIRKTVEAPVHWYGVKFEQALPELIRRLQE